MITSEFVEQSETDETRGKIFQRGVCVCVCVRAAKFESVYLCTCTCALDV